ncbi:MAG: Transcriptional regulator, AcrR family, partial [uncultured Nocardioidaceae bacterium]
EQRRADAGPRRTHAAEGPPCPAPGVRARGLRRPGLPRGGDGRHRRACRCLQAGALPALPEQARALPCPARAGVGPDHRRHHAGPRVDDRQPGPGAGHRAGLLRLRGQRPGRLPAGVRVRPDQRAGRPGPGGPGDVAVRGRDREGHQRGHWPAGRRLAPACGVTGRNGPGQRALLVGRRWSDRPVAGGVARGLAGLARHQRVPADRRAVL